MFSSAQIVNFKCFENVSLTHLKPVNVIVGDNGVGKTALLEAVFLALGESTEIPVRFKQYRGTELGTVGTKSVIEDTLVSDLYYRSQMDQEIKIDLLGGNLKKRLCRVKHTKSPQIPKTPGIAVMPPRIEFSWTNAADQTFRVGLVAVGNTFQLLGTGEDSAQYRYYAANGTVPSGEVAALFSDLSRKGEEAKFTDVFIKEFDWIEDLSIQVVAGATSVHARVKGLPETIPVALTSGAINRVLAIFLGLTVQGGIVLVDEIDTGIFHTRHLAICRILINLCKANGTQVFLTTHSGEWLEALAEAARSYEEDICLMRVERGGRQPIIKQFTGTTFLTGVSMGGEVR